VTDWLSRDTSSLLENFQRRLDAGERLPEPDSRGGSAPFASAPSGDYQGIVDDLGQSGRAANIDDLMQGFALAPYFEDIDDACDFLRLPSFARPMPEKTLPSGRASRR
jgi:hypothetical protein